MLPWSHSSSTSRSRPSHAFVTRPYSCATLRAGFSSVRIASSFSDQKWKHQPNMPLISAPSIVARKHVPAYVVYAPMLAASSELPLTSFTATGDPFHAIDVTFPKNP